MSATNEYDPDLARLLTPKVLEWVDAGRRLLLEGEWRGAAQKFSRAAQAAGVVQDEQAFYRQFVSGRTRDLAPTHDPDPEIREAVR